MSLCCEPDNSMFMYVVYIFDKIDGRVVDSFHFVSYYADSAKEILLAELEFEVSDLRDGAILSLDDMEYSYKICSLPFVIDQIYQH